MPNWAETATGLAAATTVIGAIFAALVWLIRSQQRSGAQLERNGGRSLRDAIDRIERTQNEVREDVRDIRDTVHRHHDQAMGAIGKTHVRIDEHIRDHLKGDA